MAVTVPRPKDEPEILEGLARDIVSRLTTTLFAEDELPQSGEDPLIGDGEAGAPGVVLDRPDYPHVPPAGEETPGRVGSGWQQGTGAGRPGNGPYGASRGSAVPDRRPFPHRPRWQVSERPALLVRGTVRSGRQIRHNGDIVVVGDVNPGAQLVAAGDVVVMGTLRGMVHAGATGEYTAVVAAFRLAPTQLRIASYLARPPEEPGGQQPDYPEVALVRDGVVVVRPLSPGILPRRRPATFT